MRMTGRITKWIPESGWGICNSYSNGTNAPERFFLHISRFAPDAQVEYGIKISFEPGPPRRKNDLPTALEIEIMPAQTAPAPPQSSNDGGVA
jgi:hypothetical protein